jgi:hypothetical protein
MIKNLLSFTLSGFLLAGCPSALPKEQQIIKDAARYACYQFAGEKATGALLDACPEFLQSSDKPLNCPALDLIIDVLNRDLETCDAQ